MSTRCNGTSFDLFSENMLPCIDHPAWISAVTQLSLGVVSHPASLFLHLSRTGGRTSWAGTATDGSCRAPCRASAFGRIQRSRLFRHSAASYPPGVSRLPVPYNGLSGCRFRLAQASLGKSGEGGGQQRANYRGLIDIAYIHVAPFAQTGSAVRFLRDLPKGTSTKSHRHRQALFG
jgi:hypothetical protein